MSNTQTSEVVKPLTSRERAVLAFERDTAVRDANKLEAIREHFGFTPSYYYAILTDLLDRPEAEDADPLLIRRLRRRRDQRSSKGDAGLSEQVGRPGRRPATK